MWHSHKENGDVHVWHSRKDKGEDTQGIFVTFKEEKWNSSTQKKRQKGLPVHAKKGNVWKIETIRRFIANEKPLCDRLKKCSPHMEIGRDIHPEERKYG